MSRIIGLFVIARNSTATYKGRMVDASQVGRELGVRYVLEGSFRKDRDRIRISAQLVDAATGAHVWAERYDSRSEDIFALQDEIALSVVGAIAPRLRRAEIARVSRKRPESLDAYDLVLRAQPDVDSGMPEQVRRALVLLERAIEVEPSYALAHGNAAMCHHCLYLRSGLLEAERVASISHARTAIIHGQDDALALTWAGFSIGMDGHDRAATFTALEAALAISPSSALTYILGSVMLGWDGEAERAIEWSERGVRLSPFDSWVWAPMTRRRSLIFTAAALKRPRTRHIGPFKPTRHTASPVCSWRQHSPDYTGWKKRRPPRDAVLELHPKFQYGRQ